MVKLLIGEKGSGKTKRLIAQVNEALETSKGHVICVEKDDLLRYQVSSFSMQRLVSVPCIFCFSYILIY